LATTQREKVERAPRQKRTQGGRLDSEIKGILRKGRPTLPLAFLDICIIIMVTVVIIATPPHSARPPRASFLDSDLFKASIMMMT
jgi:hypothetical protein